MSDQSRVRFYALLAIAVAVVLAAASLLLRRARVAEISKALQPASSRKQAASAPKKVRGLMQTRPRGERRSDVFPFRELDRTSTPLELKLGGEGVRVYYRQSALTAWAEDADGNLLPAVLAYEEGWKAFNPQSEIFHARASGQ